MKVKGFTLIELLVVVSIVGLLSSAVTASLNSAREKGRLAAARQFSSQADRVAGDRAIGMWNFDDCSPSTTAVDQSGNGNTLNLNGATWSTESPSGIGCSISFDGSNDEASASTANLIGSANTFTISAWIKPSSVSLESIYGEFTANGDHTRNYLLVNNEKLTFDQWPSTGGSALMSNRSIKAGAWTHVAYVQSGSTRRLYIDGVLDKEDSAAEIYSGLGPDNARVGYRGSNQGGYAYYGLVDQVRVFLKDLTASEINRLYAKGSESNGIAGVE